MHHFFFGFTNPFIILSRLLSSPDFEMYICYSLICMMRLFSSAIARSKFSPLFLLFSMLLMMPPDPSPLGSSLIIC